MNRRAPPRERWAHRGRFVTRASLDRLLGTAEDCCVNAALPGCRRYDRFAWPGQHWSPRPAKSLTTLSLARLAGHE
jgi:hypothetical protein